MTPAALLPRALADAACCAGLSLRDWDLLIRQGRAAGLLARLGILLDEAGLTGQVPDAPRHHLDSARILADKHRRDVLREVGHIDKALAPLGHPVIFLKGAAYVLADLPSARGRLFNDIDILVPREGLDLVERALLQHGWAPIRQSAYDQAYYRRWMHELPPMRHVQRQTVIDVHHTVLPTTARVTLPPHLLLAGARPARDGLLVLSPADMVLHAAAHLFNEGEFASGLRDLDDLARLLRHFGREPGFWERLAERARLLDLRRPLFYALRYGRAILGLTVPAGIEAAMADAAPSDPLTALMDGLFGRGLRVQHASCDDAFTPAALWLLYVRAHHLRMPPHLLVPHLVRKIFASKLESGAE